MVGPVIVQSSAKRSVFDIAPLFFNIQGKPESGGVRESHTTLFPLFHYGYDPDSSLFILPGYYRRVSRTADTLLSPFFSQAETRNGATSLTAIGPVVPLWWNYRDRDLGIHAWAIAPLFYTSDSPAGHDWLTPLVGRFETYGESQTWWIFPTLTISERPARMVRRPSSHRLHRPQRRLVAHRAGAHLLGLREPEGPLDGRVPAVLALRGHVGRLGRPGRRQHALPAEARRRRDRLVSSTCCPLFSYGEHPDGYFWNILFGLAGYSRDGASSQVRALWLPINFGGAPARAQASIER